MYKKSFLFNQCYKNLFTAILKRFREHEYIYTFHVFTINDAITIATGYVEFYLAKEYKRILSRKIVCIVINKIQRSINVIHMKYKIIKYINC
jgi:hypothetical protein